MTTTDAVAARFNGSDLTFRIPRGRLPHFEAAHGTAYALFKRIISGSWSVGDAATVLRFGLGDGPARDETPGTYSMRARLRESLRHIQADRRACVADAVDQAVAAHSPATYAPLVAAVLMAALMTKKRPTLHVSRFLVTALYTGSRSARVCQASFAKEPG